MIQELITYMIIGAAAYAALSKLIKQLLIKKRKPTRIDFEKATLHTNHHCDDCSADCMLRNSINPKIKNQADLCKTLEIRPKS